MQKRERLEKESYDQWCNVRRILQFAVFIIEKPNRQPPMGLLRLFTDIVLEYEALDWKQLNNQKKKLVEDDIHQYNLALRRLDRRVLLFLLYSDVPVFPLPLCPEDAWDS